MDIVERSAVLVRPRWPYIEWMESVAGRRDARACLAECVLDSNVYLIVMDEDLERILRENWRRIFKQELAAWDEDTSTWPPRRTLQMFLTWFEVSLGTRVTDLVDGPLGLEVYD